MTAPLHTHGAGSEAQSLLENRLSPAQFAAAPTVPQPKKSLFNVGSSRQFPVQVFGPHPVVTVPESSAHWPHPVPDTEAAKKEPAGKPPDAHPALFVRGRMSPPRHTCQPGAQRSTEEQPVPPGLLVESSPFPTQAEAPECSGGGKIPGSVHPPAQAAMSG